MLIFLFWFREQVWWVLISRTGWTSFLLFRVVALHSEKLICTPPHLSVLFFSDCAMLIDFAMQIVCVCVCACVHACMCACVRVCVFLLHRLEKSSVNERQTVVQPAHVRQAIGLLFQRWELLMCLFTYSLTPVHLQNMDLWSCSGFVRASIHNTDIQCAWLKDTDFIVNTERHSSYIHVN